MACKLNDWRIMRFRTIFAIILLLLLLAHPVLHGQFAAAPGTVSLEPSSGENSSPTVASGSGPCLVCKTGGNLLARAMNVLPSSPVGWEKASVPPCLATFSSTIASHFLRAPPAA